MRIFSQKSRLLNVKERCICPQTEAKLKDWIIFKRILGVSIDGATKAKEFYAEINPSDTSKLQASCADTILTINADT